MRHATLRQLKVFESVARLLSFSRAAEEPLSHISQNLTDLAIMVRPPADLDTVNLPFAPHPYAIGAAADHPLAAVRGIPLATLMREACVVREKGSDTWHSMEQGLGAHLAQLRIALAIKSTETIKQAVIAGMGVSFLSAHTIAKELQAGSLCVLDVEHFPLMLNCYVVHHRGKRLTPVAQAFRDFLISDGASLIEDTIAAYPAASGRLPLAPRRAAGGKTPSGRGLAGH